MKANAKKLYINYTIALVLAKYNRLSYRLVYVQMLQSEMKRAKWQVEDIKYSTQNTIGWV